MPEKLLAFDPSSSCTGWAVGIRDGQEVNVHYAGRLKPPGKIRGWDRIRWMGSAVGPIIREYRPARIIIEVPSGKVGYGHGGGGSGLAVYGAAAGVVDYECVERLGADKVHAITELEWARGFPKRKRSVRANLIWPGYAAVAAQDSTRDIADAVCLLDVLARQLARAETVKRLF